MRVQDAIQHIGCQSRHFQKSGYTMHCKCTNVIALGLSIVLFWLSAPIGAAEVILPDERSAYYSEEPIEFAVAGLKLGQSATLKITPQGESTAKPVDIQVSAKATAMKLPPYALAPGKYLISANGDGSVTLTIASGVNDSTMLVSQTSVRAPGGGANFILGNSFIWGRLTREGQPETNPRGKKSPGFQTFEKATAANLPVNVYMYWTGYVTHKPWGTEKSWADDDMQRAMRLFNFANAQRLRRFARNIICVGPIDEPGLSWGATPNGGMASGFPNWDEAWWYEQNGWKFTHDIASQSDRDWLKYIEVRTQIMKQSCAQAAEDHRAVWPDVVWAGDLYAPHALMDGVNPANQEVNDILTTHVFFDWSGGPLSVPGQSYLEKATRPTRKIAHAMNGQLEGQRGTMRPVYHVLMNAMLQSGLQSNWWLNTSGMKPEDLAAVNEPAKKLGPLFRNLSLDGHEVAVLYSLREHAMRQKRMAKLASESTGGEQPSLLLPLPEGSEAAAVPIATNAYEVGHTYTRQLFGVHQALLRSGYPAHIVQDTVLPELIGNYKVLVVTGQTHPMSREVQQAIGKFIVDGGQVVVDRSTTVYYPGAITHQARLSAQDIRTFLYLTGQKAKTNADTLEASRYLTNRDGLFGDQIYREAVEPIRQAMSQTAAQPVIDCEASDLSIGRHVSGDAQLIMVLNGHEQLPETPAGDKYAKFNYAPYTTTYSLRGVEADSVVYEIGGLDWGNVRLLKSPQKPIRASFEPGEMKLYLVAPQAPKGLTCAATCASGALNVQARLEHPQMPWPIQVTVTDPQGGIVYQVWRSLDAQGGYGETFPLGSNSADGSYGVVVSSPVGEPTARCQSQVTTNLAKADMIADAVRVFDAESLPRFLSDKPQVVIAVANDDQRQVAEQLARSLSDEGIKARIAGEKQVFRKVRYPRVWNPHLTVFSPGGDEKQPSGEVQKRLRAGMDEQESLVILDADGNALSEWRKPGNLVTVTGQGLLDWVNQNREQAFEAGVKLYVNSKRRVEVLNGQPQQVRATEDVQHRWSAAWQRLTRYVGNYQLPAQLPEAYETDDHLIVLGDSRSSRIVAALQAAEVVPQIADERYPGAGRALVSFVRGPFHPERNAILIAASDAAGLTAGARKVAKLARER